MKHVTDPASDREAPKPARRRYESQAECAEAVEPRYMFRGRACSARRSILSMVYDHMEELVEEFFVWCKKTNREPGPMTRPVLFECIVKWESETFGSPLYPAAHGIITFAIEVRTGHRKLTHGQREPSQEELI